LSHQLSCPHSYRCYQIGSLLLTHLYQFAIDHAAGGWLTAHNLDGVGYLIVIDSQAVHIGLDTGILKGAA
jgi:hypothetical protein